MILLRWASSFLVLVVLGQALGKDRRILLEAEEGDPPRPRRSWLTSRPGQDSFGPYLSRQINVNEQGLNILGDAANEPSFIIDPNDPMRWVAGWRQFNNVASNFRQAGYGISNDGGFSWTFPGSLEPGIFRSDPVLDANLDSQFFYNSLRNTFFTDQFATAASSFTFLNLGPATGGDKQWIAIDKTTTPSRGFQYQAWSTAGNNYGGRQFSRSVDGGSTWMSPVFLPDRPVWGTLDTDSEGVLFVGGCDGGNQFYCLRSTNARDRTQSPTFVSTPLSLGGFIDFAAPINPGGLMGQCWLVVDRSTGPHRGNVYMLASVWRNNNNPGDVMFARSTDGGRTFSSPIRINDDASDRGNYHWFGTLSVAPNGRLDACWYDTRDSSNRRDSALYHSTSFDGGQTWRPNVRMSRSFDPSLGYPNQNKLGDYIQMISDNSVSSIVYAATFNGEQDIYLAQRLLAPATINPYSFEVTSATSWSGDRQALHATDDRVVRLSRNLRESFSVPLQIVVRGFSPSIAPSQIRFFLTAQTSAPGFIQNIELFNYTFRRWDVVDRRIAPTAMTAVITGPRGEPSRFVDPLTGQVQARISIRLDARPRVSEVVTRFDLAQWQISP